MKKFYFKIVYLLLIGLLCCLIVIKLSDKSREEESGDGNLVNLLNVKEFVFQNDEYGKIKNEGNIVTYNNKPISHLYFSPQRKKLGFYYESGEYENPCSNISLGILDIDQNSVRQIFEADCSISKWEWLGNNNVAIYRSCGTECMAVYIVDAETGEEKSKFSNGVDYQWSPDKTKFLAKRYTFPGVIVGDRKGNKLFELKRTRSAEHSKLISMTKTEWSPDGSKIAIVIKKDKEEIMELLVFDSLNNFTQVYQSNIKVLAEIKLSWVSNEKLFVNEEEYNLN